MPKYIKREIQFRDIETELPETAVMTIAQAAKELNVYAQAVSQALDRGDLTLIIDPRAPKRQGRRLVLRSEIGAWGQRREKRNVRSKIIVGDRAQAERPPIRCDRQGHPVRCDGLSRHDDGLSSHLWDEQVVYSW